MSGIISSKTKYIKMDSSTIIENPYFDQGTVIYEFRFNDKAPYDIRKGNPNNDKDMIVNLLANLYLLLYNEYEKDYKPWNEEVIRSTYSFRVSFYPYDRKIADRFAFNDIIGRIFYKKNFNYDTKRGRKKHIHYDTPYNFFLDNNISINLPKDELVTKLKEKLSSLVDEGFYILKRNIFRIVIDTKFFRKDSGYYSGYEDNYYLQEMSFPDVCPTKYYRLGVRNNSKLGYWGGERPQYVIGYAEGIEWRAKFYHFLNRLIKPTYDAMDYPEAYKKKNMFTKDELRPFFDSIIRLIPSRTAFDMSKEAFEITKAKEGERYARSPQVLSALIRMQRRARINKEMLGQYGYNSFNREKRYLSSKWNTEYNFNYAPYYYRGGTWFNMLPGYKKEMEKYVTDIRTFGANAFVYAEAYGESLINNGVVLPRKEAGLTHWAYENRFMRNVVNKINTKLISGGSLGYKDKQKNGAYHQNSYKYSFMDNPFYGFNKEFFDNSGYKSFINDEEPTVWEIREGKPVYSRRGAIFLEKMQYSRSSFRPEINKDDDPSYNVFEEIKKDFMRYHDTNHWFQGLPWMPSNFEEMFKLSENQMTDDITGNKIEYDMYYEDEDGKRVFLEENVYHINGRMVMKYNIAGIPIHRLVDGEYFLSDDINMKFEDRDRAIEYYNTVITGEGGIPYVYIRE